MSVRHHSSEQYVLLAMQNNGFPLCLTMSKWWQELLKVQYKVSFNPSKVVNNSLSGNFDLLSCICTFPFFHVEYRPFPLKWVSTVKGTYNSSLSIRNCISHTSHNYLLSLFPNDIIVSDHIYAKHQLLQLNNNILEINV